MTTARIDLTRFLKGFDKPEEDKELVLGNRRLPADEMLVRTRVYTPGTPIIGDNHGYSFIGSLDGTLKKGDVITLRRIRAQVTDIQDRKDGTADYFTKVHLSSNPHLPPKTGKN